MKRNIFVDPDIGNTLKKFTMYFSVFFLVFGLTMIIRNAGDTYAASDVCPAGWNELSTKCYKYYSTKSECDSDYNDGNTYGATCVATYDSDDVINGYKVELNIVEVTYDYDGGTIVRSSERTYKGNTISLPSLHKVGHTSLGWYYNGSNGAVRAGSGNDEFPVNNDISLYARWDADDFTVTYNGNGGNPVKGSETVEYNKTGTFPNAGRTGYKLTGWTGKYSYCTESADNPIYDVGESTPVIKDNKTYYACWNEVKYTVTLDANGGTVSPSTVSVRSGETYTLPTPTRTGYTFGGWYKNYVGSAASDVGEKITVSADTLLVADWKVNEYTIVFDSQQGEYVTPIKGEYGTVITLPTTTKLGYSFMGWTHGDDFKGVGSYTIEDNVTLVAVWDLASEGKCYVCNANQTATWGPSAPTCPGGTSVEKTEINNSDNCKFLTVTYDLKGGSMTGGTTVKVFYNGTVVLPEPSKSGFTFGGWYKNYVDSAASPVGDVGSSITVKLDTLLVAKWTEKSNGGGGTTPDLGDGDNPNGGENTPTVTEYNVTFVLNGGKLYENDAESSSLVRKLSNLDYSKYVAKKENNTFNGWSTASACTNPVKTGTLKLENDITLYACYTENEVDDGNKDDGEVTNKTYKVTFKLDGGKLYKSSKETTKTVWELSSIKYTDWTAKKDGHTFKGWSKDKECSKIVGTSEKVTEDMSLWACYDKDETKPSKPSTPDKPTNDKTEDEVDKNQQTGSWFVYMVLILGAVALGYAGYNAYKYSEVRK